MIRREPIVRRIGARPRVAKPIRESEPFEPATARGLEETLAVAFTMRGVMITGATEQKKIRKYVRIKSEIPNERLSSYGQLEFSRNRPSCG